MYEKRWREVCAFVRKFNPLRSFFPAAWDGNRYTRGVDASGATREVQAGVQARQEAQQNISQFNPGKLTKDVQSAKFHSFFELVLLVEVSPSELAQACEVCPCHAILLEGRSSHMRQKMLEKLCGKVVTYCPMAGMGLADFVAAGDLWGITSVLS